MEDSYVKKEKLILGLMHYRKWAFDPCWLKPNFGKARFSHNQRAGPVCLQGLRRLQNRIDWHSVCDMFSCAQMMEVTDESE
jgi:hypothetical protein